MGPYRTPAEMPEEQDIMEELLCKIESAPIKNWTYNEEEYKRIFLRGSQHNEVVFRINHVGHAGVLNPRSANAWISFDFEDEQKKRVLKLYYRVVAHIQEQCIRNATRGI